MSCWGYLGEAADWSFDVGVSVSSNSLQETGAIGWNAADMTELAIGNGDGFGEFTTREATTHEMVGLTDDGTRTAFETIDFAILLASNGKRLLAFSRVRGWRPSRRIRDLRAGRSVQVAVDGGVVKYLKNGVPFYTSYTSALPPIYPLLVDTALYSPGATVIEVALAGLHHVWTHVVVTSLTG